LRKISVIVAPHGSPKSRTWVLSLPLVVGVGALVAAGIMLFVWWGVEVADLKARTRELATLREENDSLKQELRRVEELEGEIARLQELATRVRRWAGIGVTGESAEVAFAADRRDWVREQARLEELPTLCPVTGWMSRGFEVGVDGHAGIDFAGETGTEVVASAAGVVQFAGWDETFGNVVILDHGDGVTSLYGHNDSLLVESGETVSRGRPIAHLGNTGRSSAPHVHFEVRLEGEPLDPACLLSWSSRDLKS
jgi:murein DD-endopeptidase MepM/ murein hydrolase activator NlpD